ncbi:carbon starvation CstA family protein [Sphingomonas sp. HF-S3]|uniref:Carbon starvation CstA family protein n=1 Tax=Sphingomonas rustica TaxID=3103142 RepID=A0ABV0B2I6_9SPHN
MRGASARNWVALAPFVLIACAAALALGVIARGSGEPVNALWLLTAATCVYILAYRFYGRFIARRVLQIDPSRPTPAVRRADGLDYVPTDRFMTFGHHFAAIAGAGPLVGPVLAAQLGYLPGMLWILVGVVVAGAVQDMVVLFLSTRRDGLSLGRIARDELGAVAGTVISLGLLLIMIILLAVLALVVVKALAESPWGTFTVFATMPIAVLMGLYGRFFRPGRPLEIALLGAVLLMVSVVLGGHVAQDPALAAWFTFDAATLALMLIGYGIIASLLPVWLLLAPRDYLSSFLKLGTILLLAVGLIFTAPSLQMPAVTPFIDGSGPVFAGSLFPFLFITIACGAVSGFHALIASGTTPKMIASEGDIPLVGFGGMLAESFVAMMALIAATILHPGLYFAINSPAALIGTDAATAAATISQWGYAIDAATLLDSAKAVGEHTLLSRTGGGPTLAVGISEILSALGGPDSMKAFWYHFAILFEALFILTTVDAGTRVARFMIQDFGGTVSPWFGDTTRFAPGALATALAAGSWGYLLYQGAIDPLGGINSLWPLFGIANQMLAVIALLTCTVAILRSSRRRYWWVTGVPALALTVITLTAGVMKLFAADPRVGFLSHAASLDPAKTGPATAAMLRGDYTNAVLTAVLILVVLVAAASSLRGALRILRGDDGQPVTTAHG